MALRYRSPNSPATICPDCKMKMEHRDTYPAAPRKRKSELPDGIFFTILSAFTPKDNSAASSQDGPQTGLSIPLHPFLSRDNRYQNPQKNLQKSFFLPEMILDTVPYLRPVSNGKQTQFVGIIKPQYNHIP